MRRRKICAANGGSLNESGLASYAGSRAVLSALGESGVREGWALQIAGNQIVVHLERCEAPRAGAFGVRLFGPGTCADCVGIMSPKAEPELDQLGRPVVTLTIQSQVRMSPQASTYRRAIQGLPALLAWDWNEFEIQICDVGLREAGAYGHQDLEIGQEVALIVTSWGAKFQTTARCRACEPVANRNLLFRYEFDIMTDRLEGARWRQFVERQMLAA